MALVFSGFTTAVLYNPHSQLKKAYTTKAMFVKKHKKMHARTDSLHKENRRAEKVADKTSSMASKPSSTSGKNTTMEKKLKLLKCIPIELCWIQPMQTKRIQKCISI